MKEKKTVILILVMMLSSSAPAAFSKDEISVDYVFEPVMIDNQSCQLMIKDTHLLEIPGKPLVLYYPASILLPQGTMVKDIKVKTSAPVVQTGFELPWGQPPCTFSDDPVMVGRNEEIYNSDNDYPDTLFDVVSMGSFRGFQILNVHLFPVQYKPRSQTVKFYQTMTVEVKLGKGLKNELYRGLQGDKEAVTSMVDNPEVVSTYEDGGTPLATEEYIIITSSTLESTFQDLADWKAYFVNGASVYTTTWIYSNYTGTDNQMKIRNFIIDKYTNNGLKYVLLGGDTGVVPYRGFYVSTGGYTDSGMAADMYYGHLDGTHNADGDTRYGETNDNVDFYAEVAVGRAPVDNTTEAAAFVEKVIIYEQMTKPTRVCFHQSRVMAGNSPDSRCLAYNCDDWIPSGYTIHYLFEEGGTVTQTKWRNAFNAGPIVVVHIGHGNTTLYHINYEVGGTVNWSTSDCPTFSNTFFPWTTSVACICGEFEASDCLAEQYVKDDCGAIGAIYNDNYGWFSTNNACMYSGEFCEMEIRGCWSDGYEKLGDLLNRSRYYMASSASSNTTYRWCFYERNLIGDPESPCLTKRHGPIPSDTVTITNPSNGAAVSGTVTITTSTTGCIDTVEFYIDSILKFTDTALPFSWNWDTTQYSSGQHTIMVKGYCSGVFKDSDVITVTLNIPPIPYVTITYPYEGQTISGTITCTANSNCDSVKWYIDGVFVGEDASAPFKYIWDTEQESNGSHTIKIEGLVGGVYQCEDSVNITVDNSVPYITITYPLDGQTVSGIVTVTTDTNCDEVRFYLNDKLKHTDYTAPFTWDWDTTQYKKKKLKAEGYCSGVLMDSDQIKVKVKNPSIALLSFLVLFLSAGIIYRRR